MFPQFSKPREYINTGLLGADSAGNRSDAHTLSTVAQPLDYP